MSIVIWGGASENNINSICVVVNKILRIILYVTQDDHNIPEIGTYALIRLISWLYLLDWKCVKFKLYNIHIWIS